MELVRPSVEYRDSYLAAIAEFEDVGLRNRGLPFRYENYKEDFERFVAQLNAMSDEEGLLKGRVPQTDYWLIDQGEYIGRVSIRHSLTPDLNISGGQIGYDIRPSMRGRGYGKKILELALPKVRELGLDRVLLTCDETNAASRKIIEVNGGILENKVPNPEGGPDKLRFWIQL